MMKFYWFEQSMCAAHVKLQKTWQVWLVPLLNECSHNP